MKKEFKYKVRRTLFLYIPFTLTWIILFAYILLK